MQSIDDYNIGYIISKILISHYLDNRLFSIFHVFNLFDNTQIDVGS